LRSYIKRLPYLTREKVLELAADVTAMNHALFDTADLPDSPPFDSCVYGIHYRLATLGVIYTDTDIRWINASGLTRVEKGRPGLEEEIDLAYSSRPYLTDNSFLTAERLAQWKKELGI